MPEEPATLPELLEWYARLRPEAPAILSTSPRPHLNYASLLETVVRIAAKVRGCGIGRQDRIALLAPDGPEAATAFLAISSCAACAPLNPRYREQELEFYLRDLGPKLLVVVAGVETPAPQVAAQLGIPVVELVPEHDGPAGTLRWPSTGYPEPAGFRWPEAGDIALLLHTSGTTSRPKLVPLTHRNLMASARHIASSLALTPEDRCLNVMPLFHVHGLVGALLASLYAGASVACAPGFLAPEFLDWLEQVRPTWYTAVPTIHQAVLARVAATPEKARIAPLRFIRSCSAPLAPSVFEQLEQVFGVPVIEAYGMTEAAHQIASNPLPPRPRKPGSVGIPAGPQVAIMDSQGNLLPAGAPGEVVIQGPNVTSGYLNNPEANSRAFIGGWFRTGDQGYFDEDGYLFLTGRLKELINRAGEKIAPREIDEVLLEHPAVAQALAFAMPDEKVGEEVAAAVVLKPGASVTAAELQEFVARRLADFKVPRKVVFLTELPKGPTGKPQRIGLAEKLGLVAGPHNAEPSRYRPPRTDVEQRLCQLFERVLRLKRVGIYDDFFDLGGDSLLALRLLAELEKVTGRAIPPVVLMQHPTVAGLAEWLSSTEAKAYSSCLVPLNEGRGENVFLLIHGGQGQVLMYRELARRLQPGWTVYAVQPPRNGHPSVLTSMERLARLYVNEVRQSLPGGPYVIGGTCIGAFLALEMACQLEEAGLPVAGLVSLNTDGVWRTLDNLPASLRFHLDELQARKSLRAKLAYPLERLGYRMDRVHDRLCRHLVDGMIATGFQPPARWQARWLKALLWQANRSWRPRRLERPVLVLQADPQAHLDPRRFWSRVSSDVQVRRVPGKPEQIFFPPAVDVLVRDLRETLRTWLHVASPA